MRVLNLLYDGNIGGIQTLCREMGLYASFEMGFCFLCDEGLIYEQMKAKGLSVYSLAGGRRVTIRKLRTLQRIAEPYDIIICQFNEPYTQLYYLFLKWHYPRKKFVLAQHTCFNKAEYYEPYGGLKHVIAQVLLKAVNRRSDKFIFVSHAGLRSYLMENRIPMEKTGVVYNGIGPELLQAGIQSVYTVHHPIEILYIGRLNKVKGVHLLIRAAAALKEQYRIHLTIVGDGPEREALHQLAAQEVISDMVCFAGQQGDIIPYLSKADLFAYPSTWEEVFGISIAEAMAFGIPCITNRVGGIPEIMEDGVSGYFSREISWQGIRDAIARGIQDIHSGEIFALRTAARNTAERFSIEHTLIQLEKELRPLMMEE